MVSAIKTIILAMTPLNELRGTIPVAVGIYRLSPLWAYCLAVVGNILPVFFLLWFWPKVTLFCQSWSLARKILNWLFERTRQRFYKKYSLYGDLALILFVAIPLPLTGAWTGSIAAFLFGIPYFKSLYLIFFGVVIAGIIVTLASAGFFSLIKVI